MTDRELLELAAKAAGYKKFVMHTDMAEVSSNANWSPQFANWVGWNPLTDDGDALRLAVKLKMWVQTNEASVCVELWQSEDGETKQVTEYFDYPEEAYAATRRAIVRAAAGIGRSMK